MNGSLSFNQVLFQYRYSDEPCISHQEAALNFYEPVDNIKGFALHTALTKTDTGNCPGAFYRAYVKLALTKTHTGPAPLKYRHGTSGAWQNVAAEDDAYDILAKAIAGYNGGSGFFEQQSWASILRQTRKPVKADTYGNTLSGRCFSCQYTIEVRNQRYGLPYRQYLWKGGDYAADLKLADGTPDPNAGKAWCFVYGEQEWITDKLWGSIKQAASNKDARGNAQVPVGNVTCP